MAQTAPLSEASEIDQQAREARRSLREAFGPFATGARDRSLAAYQYAQSQMTTHPGRSAGVAFGLGVVLGALIAMAARRH